MKSVNKNVGFCVLAFLSAVNLMCGNQELGAAFFISALFYDAIKKD